MTRQEKISKIYAAMADKTLSVGCLCYLDDAVFYSVCKSDKVTTEQDSLILYRHSDDEYYSITSIIGHPVRIGEVLGSMTEYTWHLRDELFSKWSKFRLPIDEQSDLCIDFVYSLISNSRIS